MTSSGRINSNDPKQNEPVTSSTRLEQAEISEIVVMLAAKTMPWLGWRGAAVAVVNWVKSLMVIITLMTW